MRIADPQRSLAFLIIILATLAGLYLVYPIFGKGFIMNEDLPSRFGEAACFSKSSFWSLPIFWCPYNQAGIAPMQGYEPGYAHIIALLNWVVPIDLAFKLALVLFYFALPLGALAFLIYLGQPLAGALAFLFLLVEQGSTLGGGYVRLFEFGGIGYALAQGIEFLVLIAGLAYAKMPNLKNLAWLILATSAFSLTYPALALSLVLPLGIIAFLYWKEVSVRGWRDVALYPATVFLLTSYWLVPFLSKLRFFFFNPPPVLSFHELNAQFLGGLSKPLLLIGVMGVYWIWTRHGKEWRFLAAYCMSIFVLLALWAAAPGLPIFSFFAADHLLGEIRTLFFIAAAMALSGILTMAIHKKSVASFVGGAVLILLLTGMAFSHALQERKKVILYPYDLPTMAQIEKQFPEPHGRILVEDIYNRHVFRVKSHPFAAGSFFTKRELLGTGAWWFQKDDLSGIYSENLFNGSINKTDDAELLRRFSDYNIEYVVAFSPALDSRVEKLPFTKVIQVDTITPLSMADKEGLANLTVDQTISGPKGAVLSWSVYKIKLPLGYFSIRDGHMIEESYVQLNGKATLEANKDTIALFKVRFWPNWKAWIDDAPVPVQRNDLGVMQVAVPKGRHTIRFEYTTLWTEVVGYIFTLVGIGIIALLLRKEGTDSI